MGGAEIARRNIFSLAVLFLLHFLCFLVFSLSFCGAHVPPRRKKKGCSKAALRDLQCYQRLKTYIVTSKPKRISVYSGLVHMVRLLQRVSPLHRGVHGRFFTTLGRILLQPFNLP